MIRPLAIPRAEERSVLASDRGFLLICALLFVLCGAGSVYWCRSMSGSMAMTGGWAMSMAWMGMGGQPWLSAAAAFLGMWMLMMVAMMLPSLIPALLSHRRQARQGGANRIWLMTAVIGLAISWCGASSALWPTR